MDPDSLHGHEDTKKRILVVEDEWRLRRLLTDYLNQKGFHAADAESGPMALALQSLFRPDMVLLDIFMPGMDGLEVLRRMKAWAPDVAVVMLTAAHEEAMAHKAMELGALDYLTKPFHLEQLNTILSVHLLMMQAEK